MKQFFAFIIMIVSSVQAFAGASQHLKSISTSSAHLLSQITVAKGVESLIEKDPLILSEFVSYLGPQTLLVTPSVLAVFHVSSSKTTEGLSKYLAKRTLPSLLKSSSSYLVEGAGLTAGAMAVHIVFDLLSTDIINYADKETQVSLLSSMLGLWGGYGTSVATNAAGTYLVSSLGMLNPATRVALGFSSGVVFFVSSSYYEKWVEGVGLYNIKLNDLKTVQSEVPKMLSYDRMQAQFNDKSMSGYFDTHLKNLRQSYAAVRSELLKSMIDNEKRHLNALIQKRTEYYRLIRYCEWIKAGANVHDPDYLSNKLNWTEASLPLDWNIQLTLLQNQPEAKAQVLDSYIVLLNQKLDTYVSKYEGMWQSQRQKEYDKLLNDDTLLESYRTQLLELVTLLEGYTQSAPKTVLALNRAKSFLNSSDIKRYSKSIFNMISTAKFNFSEETQAVPAHTNLRIESLFADARMVAREFYSQSNRTYYNEVVDKSQDAILEYLKVNNL